MPFQSMRLDDGLIGTHAERLAIAHRLDSYWSHQLIPRATDVTLPGVVVVMFLGPISVNNVTLRSHLGLYFDDIPLFLLLLLLLEDAIKNIMREDLLPTVPILFLVLQAPHNELLR